MCCFNSTRLSKYDILMLEICQKIHAPCVRAECPMRQFVRNFKVLSRELNTLHTTIQLYYSIYETRIPKGAVIVRFQTMSTDLKCERIVSLGISLTQGPIRNVTMATSAGGQQLEAACEGNWRNSAIIRDV